MSDDERRTAGLKTKWWLVSSYLMLAIMLVPLTNDIGLNGKGTWGELQRLMQVAALLSGIGFASLVLLFGSSIERALATPLVVPFGLIAFEKIDHFF